MTAEELFTHVGNLERAAEVVEAIDDVRLQRQRGWDLAGWRYELIPWGVRFVRRERRGSQDAEVFVLAVLNQRTASAAGEPGFWVVVSGG
jgi:hypothetical protein